MKECAACHLVKPESEFFTDTRYGRPRAKCKACCKGAWAAPTRTPEQRAEYRRRKGIVGVPYVPKAVIMSCAAEARAADARAKEVRAFVLEVKRLARACRRASRIQYRPEQLQPSTSPPCLIQLYGKHAVGEHTHAIVDADMVEYLSRWHWKAKWNEAHNNIYAVRNTWVDGIWRMVRMHRAVAGLGVGDSWEPDHLNHNGLDNRRANLVVGSHGANMINLRTPAASRKATGARMRALAMATLPPNPTQGACP